MKSLICLVLLSLCVIQSPAQKPEWFIKLQKLQKGRATERDVQKLFGSPKITYSTPAEEVEKSKTKTKVIQYDLTVGKLSVHYSAGKCSTENTQGWDFEDGAILSYDFSLYKSLPVSTLKLNLGAFPRVGKSYDTAHQYYSDFDKAVTYTVYGSELQTIRYWIPNLEKFSCETINKRK